MTGLQNYSFSRRSKKHHKIPQEPSFSKAESQPRFVAGVCAAQGEDSLLAPSVVHEGVKVPLHISSRGCFDKRLGRRPCIAQEIEH